MQTNIGFVYLLQEREFIRSEQPIYKIGKTKRNMQLRSKEYPKDSEVILDMKVKNCDIMETLIKEQFIKDFKQRKDIGTEYFEGNVDLMADTINCLKQKLDKILAEKENIPNSVSAKINKKIEEISIPIQDSINDDRYCSVCKQRYYSKSTLKRHYSTQKHIRNAAQI